jgi:hypothetical protein
MGKWDNGKTIQNERDIDLISYNMVISHILYDGKMGKRPMVIITW